MDQQWTESSVFRPATTALLDRLDRRIAEQRCTFLMSSNYINAASTKLAYLISSSLTARGGAEHYLSFLINSTVEALSGAVKLARQTSVRAKRDDGGWVLLLDAKGVFASFVDPTSRGVEEAITPHVVVVPDAARAVEAGPKHAWSAVVVVRDESMTESLAKELEPLLRDARARGSMVVLCDSELEPGDDRLFTDPLGADVAAASRIFGTVDGQGAMLRLRLRRGYFPFDHRSKFGVLLEMAAAQLIFERSGIFVFLLRFLHRTVTTEEDAREVVRRLEVGMRDVRPRQMYRFMASRMLFAAGAKGLSRLVAGRLARPRYSTGK